MEKVALTVSLELEDNNVVGFRVEDVVLGIEKLRDDGYTVAEVRIVLSGARVYDIPVLAGGDQ